MPRILKLTTGCTYSTTDCSTEDECACPQYSPMRIIPIRKIGLMEEIRIGAESLGEFSATAFGDMVWHRGRVISYTLPSPFMRF